MIIASEVAATKWMAETFDVPRETFERFACLQRLVESENRNQNLIARGSFDDFQVRHVADSAQLLRFAPSPRASWLDLGTGGGFPGLVIALLHGGHVTLVESRKLRADFLAHAAGELGLADRTTVILDRAERMAPATFDVISARAFAPLPRLLDLAWRFSTEDTVWVLPKGRGAKSELEEAMTSWQGEFRLEPSITAEGADIIVARGVCPRMQKKAP